MWAARRIGALLVVLVVQAGSVILSPESAQAVPYFNGPEGFGFDNSSIEATAKYQIEDADAFEAAGQRKFNDGSFAIVLSVEQDVHIADGFFEVDVTWQIKNKTDETIDRVIVFFTALAGPPAFPDYFDAEIELFPEDGKQFRVIRYEDGDEEFFFLGFAVRNLEPGRDDERERKFSYRVAGPVIGGETPTMGVLASFNPTVVPEPATGLLVAFGLVGLAARGRKRCA